ncbi:hypothetical protein ACUR5C_10305 [Aliikangiella sp. IMCC44653]
MVKRIAWLLMFLLTGCTSVPLSSLVKLNSLGQQGLVNVLPQEVRARISLSAPGALEPKDVSLVLKFEFSGDRPAQHLFKLKQISSKLIPAETGFFVDQPAKNQYVFKIAPSSQQDFRRMQREFSQYGKPDKYYWTVYYYLKPESKHLKSLSIDLELLLSAADDYFFLIKDGTIDKQSIN